MVAEDLDTLGDASLFIDAGGEQRFIVLYPCFWNKSQANEDKKN